MQPQILVVSDPPHGDLDPELVAAALGLSVEDTEPKLRFPAPEVLMASEAHRAMDLATSLRDAGMHVVVVDGHELARVPWPEVVSSMEFGDEALVARVRGQEVRVPYDEKVFGVFCRPPADFPLGGPDGAHAPDPDGPIEGPALSEAIQWLELLDLYVSGDDGPRRLTIVRGATEVLDATAGGSGNDSAVSWAVGQCTRRFGDLEMDTRLDGVRPRQRFVMGAEDFDLDLRKLFSFGTLLLRSVLDSISHELSDLTQYELGSRMAWVLSRKGTR